MNNSESSETMFQVIKYKNNIKRDCGKWKKDQRSLAELIRIFEIIIVNQCFLFIIKF